MYVANLMRPGVYHPVTRRGEELPPETNLLPLEKDHRFPPHGACFDDQLTRPLHANYCYNTKQRAYTKKIKIGHYVNTTVKHYGNVFVHKGGELENRQFLAKMHQFAQIASQISKISIPGERTPLPRPLPARRTALRASTRGRSSTPDSFILPLKQTAG